VVPLPLLSTLVGALAINEFGSDEQRKALLEDVGRGDVVVACALDPLVAFAEQAHWFLAPGADGGLRLIDRDDVGLSMESVDTTDGQSHALVRIDSGAGQPLGGPGAAAWLDQRLTVARCATLVGVCEEAVAVAATYTSNRLQFGRPLSTFQGVAMRAADASIDTEAMRVTMWQAAWLLAGGREATAEVEVAAWWAAEAGYRVVHATQHLHGGIGADVSYPIHRYFLWGKQLVLDLGGAGRRLSALGDTLAGAR
jgi:alkylation response protein AidB-like acyl-CoA dehydrogenase